MQSVIVNWACQPAKEDMHWSLVAPFFFSFFSGCSSFPGSSGTHPFTPLVPTTPHDPALRNDS